MTYNSEGYVSAMAQQGRTVRELVLAGYQKKHAASVARQWYPTPAQARMRAARLAKKEGK